MRDIFNNKSILEVLDKIPKSIPTIKQEIATISDIEIKNRIKRFLLSLMIEKTIAHYSVGDDKETVKASLLETITAFEDGFEWKGFRYSYGGYDTMIWLISLGILCDIALEDFRRITAILKRDGANDKLLSKLIRYKDPDWQQSNKPVIQEHPYASAVNIKTAADIKYYLNKKWYQGHSDAYWHGLHKNKRVNNYFGYWSWESGVLAKIENIDDSSLQNQKYYPYDAVHW